MEGFGHNMTIIGFILDSIFHKITHNDLKTNILIHLHTVFWNALLVLPLTRRLFGRFMLGYFHFYGPFVNYAPYIKKTVFWAKGWFCERVSQKEAHLSPRYTCICNACWVFILQSCLRIYPCKRCVHIIIMHSIQCTQSALVHVWC